jgi:hypothetical protein
MSAPDHFFGRVTGIKPVMCLIPTVAPNNIFMRIYFVPEGFRLIQEAHIRM